MGLRASLVRYAGGAVLEPHAHAAGSVSVVLAGMIEEDVGRRTEVGRLGSLVAKPAGVEHCNRVGRDGAILLAVSGKDSEAITAGGWRWTQSHPAAALGLQLARALNSGAAADAEQLFDLLGLVAELRPARTPTAWLDSIRSRLEREPNPPSVAELAGLKGVHPVYLARAFRQRFGCSLRDYRRRARVRRAANLLASSTLPIAEIAARLDFFDQSHLCRDFRAELAVSPRAYRAIVRS
ncbi:MAG TPA: helix-turn-helix domain-containing protein [Sphingomicrobium sp.]